MRRVPALLLSLACACAAHGQTTVSFTALSDDRYRGYSLTGGRPTAQFGLSYDSDAGWYAGTMVARVRYGDDSGWETQDVSYVGLARRFASGVNADLGFSRSVYSVSHDYNYHEAFAGIALGNLSGRLYFSPDYYGRGRENVYAEVAWDHALGDALSVQAHLGAQQADPFGRTTGTRHPPQFDVRFGVTAAVPSGLLALTWSGRSRGSLLRETPGVLADGSALTLSFTRGF